MCFSATASFSASAVLAVTGIVALRHARSPKVALFASTPLLFAAQQAAEGVVWITDSATVLHRLAVYFFLSFAFIIWPLWIPSVLSMIEKSHTRIKMLYVSCGAGVLFACYALMRMMQGVHVEVSNHIHYMIGNYQEGYLLAMTLYLCATVVPFFLSTYRYMAFVGALIALSYGATVHWYTHHFVSVWCFFAALISVFVLLVVMSDEMHHPSERR